MYTRSTKNKSFQIYTEANPECGAGIPRILSKLITGARKTVAPNNEAQENQPGSEVGKCKLVERFWNVSMGIIGPSATTNILELQENRIRRLHACKIRDFG